MNTSPEIPHRGRLGTGSPGDELTTCPVKPAFNCFARACPRNAGSFHACLNKSRTPDNCAITTSVSIRSNVSVGVSLPQTQVVQRRHRQARRSPSLRQLRSQRQRPRQIADRRSHAVERLEINHRLDMRPPLAACNMFREILFLLREPSGVRPKLIPRAIRRSLEVTE